MFFVIWGRIKGGIFIAEKKKIVLLFTYLGPWCMLTVGIAELLVIQIEMMRRAPPLINRYIRP